MPVTQRPGSQGFRLKCSLTYAYNVFPGDRGAVVVQRLKDQRAGRDAGGWHHIEWQRSGEDRCRRPGGAGRDAPLIQREKVRFSEVLAKEGLHKAQPNVLGQSSRS